MKPWAVMALCTLLWGCYGLYESVMTKVCFVRWAYNEMFCTDEKRLKEHEETKEINAYIYSGKFLQDFQD